MIRLALLAAGCGAASAPPSNLSSNAPPNPRAAEVFAHPEWIGHEVTIDVVEPIESLDGASGVAPGSYEIELHEEHQLVLAPGTLAKLPKLHPPVTIRGELGKTGAGLQLAVAETRPLTPSSPEALASADELEARPEQWDGKRVVVEDNYLVGFETSRLGEHVWLEYGPDTTVHCEPKDDPQREEEKLRVRVVGYAYTKGGRYGHLGGSRAEIVATDVTYLGGACK